MQTRLSKYSAFDPNFPPKWSNYFYAGTDWLMALQILINNRDGAPRGVFSVEPTIVALCLELFTKALVAYEDKQFNEPEFKKKFNHDTIKIMQEYQDNIPIFKAVISDSELLSIFAEYEREAIGLRYGEVGGNFAGDEKKKLTDLIYVLRQEVCNRTGLH